MEDRTHINHHDSTLEEKGRPRPEEKTAGGTNSF